MYWSMYVCIQEYIYGCMYYTSNYFLASFRADGWIA
jgi:hypothetical protein